MEFIPLCVRNVCNQELIQKQKNSILFPKARKDMTMYNRNSAHIVHFVNYNAALRGITDTHTGRPFPVLPTNSTPPSPLLAELLNVPPFDQPGPSQGPTLTHHGVCTLYMLPGSETETKVCNTTVTMNIRGSLLDAFGKVVKEDMSWRHLILTLTLVYCWWE